MKAAPAPDEARRQRRVLRRLLQVCAGAFVLVVFAVLGVLAINLPDRDLTDAARAWLRPLSAKPQGDGAMSLWALDAPAGVDPAQAGRAVIEAYRAREPVAATTGDWGSARPYTQEALVLPIELGCVDPASACVASALGHSHLVRELAQKRAALLQRIDALDAEATVAEALPPSEPNAPSAQFATLVAAQSLSLALAAVDVGDGKLDVGLPRLERMTRVARKLLAGCQTLACKATSTGMLRRALLVYSELINQTPAAAALANSLARVNAPMTPAERDLSSPLAFEMQIAWHLDQALVHARPTPSDPLAQRIALMAAPLLFRPQATFNLQATLADLEKPLATADARAFAREGDAVMKQFRDQAEDIGHIGVLSLYNPLGRVLAAGLPDITGIASQLHDVEVLQEAMRAKVLLLAAHQGAAGASDFLARKPEGVADPYSGNAFQWDAALASIVLPQKGSRPVSKLRVVLAS